MENNNNIDTDNLQLASYNDRIKAFIIDDLLITFVVTIMLWDQIVQAGDNYALMLALLNQYAMPVLVLKFIYQTFFIWYYGATLGKMAAKIKVIEYDQFGRVELKYAMVRSFGRIISEMFFYIGFIIGFFTDGRQTFHDKIGKTLVVNA